MKACWSFCALVPLFAAACSASSGSGDSGGMNSGGRGGAGSNSAGANSAGGNDASGGSGEAGSAGSAAAGVNAGGGGGLGAGGSGGTLSPVARTSLDTLVFGDAASESEHQLVERETRVVVGALEQSARQLMPREPAAVNGGDLSFALKIDSARRNYVTVKFWGGEGTTANASDMGRLYLYIVKDGQDYQVGYRHEGDYAPLNVAASKPPLPGRFFYSTTLLPLAMTFGQSSITLKIVATGRIFPLGSGVAPTGNYQFLMNTGSRALYRAYSHVDPLLVPQGERQGAAPARAVRRAPGKEVLEAGGRFFASVNERIENRLSTAVSVANFSGADVLYLARSYAVAGLAGYRNPAVISRVVALIDAFARDYYLNGAAAVSGGGNDGWGGRYGNLGMAISLLLPELTSALAEQVDYGAAAGSRTRRAAWAEILVKSRDYGRTTRDGKSITNQNILNNVSVYMANRGLLALADANAFPTKAGERYLREAIGLEPWLGSDLEGGGSSERFGKKYYQVTRKGLSREWGYVGVSYGEMQSYAADFFVWTGDAAFKTRATEMTRARSYFRRPAVEVAGDSFYAAMEGIGLLAWRGAPESDGDFADEIAYGDRTGGGARALRVAAVTLDPAALGYAQQMLADNQYFSTLDNALVSEPSVLDVFQDYPSVVSAAASSARLPMSDGQANFAWADEENGVVAIKHDTERLWIAPYWQAKSGTGINGLARFHFSTPEWDQYGVLETSPEFDSSGKAFVRPDRIDKPENDFYTPPERPLQAYAGEKLPLALSELVAAPADPNQESYAPFRGRANFYALRFGHYLIGLNMSPSKSARLPIPASEGSVLDLTTNASHAAEVAVRPLETSVLFLNSVTDAEPLPSAPLWIEASALSSNSANISWTRASGASGYNLKRAAQASGPFVTVSAKQTPLTFEDATLAPGQSYVYEVTSVNAYGESGSATSASVQAKP